MKKGLLLFIAIILVGVAQAQFEAKINPLGAIFGKADISAEYVVSDMFGVEASVDFAFGQAYNGFIRIPNAKQSGVGARIVGKIYFSADDGGDGWFGGLYLRNNVVKYEDKSPSDEYNFNEYEKTVFAVGVEFGQKWIFDSGFIFEYSYGIGRPISEQRVGYTDEFDFGIDMFARTSIGYRFNY